VKRRFRVALGVALAALATAALLELSVRAIDLAPPLLEAYADNVPDPHIPYKRRPGSVRRGRWHTGEFDYEFRHNRLGFRDEEHGEAKPEGVFRILFLGDSFTYGSGASFEATWPSVVERLLNARPGSHPRVEAIRMGLPRYFPAAERLVLEHYGLRFAPDLVAVGVLPNDVLDTHYGLDAIQVDASGALRTREGRYLGETGRWLFVHSHALRIVLGGLVEAIRARRDPVRFDDVYRAGGMHEDDWVAMESDLSSIAALAAQGGAKLVLVSIPQRGPWGPEHHYPDRRLLEWTAPRGIPLIAVLPHFEAATGSRPLFWKRDGHCTEEGYAVIGRAVAASLGALRLVP
jgi:hypothetical protein